MLKKLCCTLLSFVLIFTASYSTIYASDDDTPVKAKVLSVIDIQPKEERDSREQVIDVSILEGEFKDEVITLERSITEYHQNSFEIKKGDTVLVKTTFENNTLDGILINTWRVGHLSTLIIIFLVCILIFGRLKGMLSLISLIFSGFVIFKFLIPNILRGHNTVVLTIISVILISTVSFILIAGFTKKALISILGTVGGTLIAFVLCYIYTDLTRLTGLVEEDVVYLIASTGIEIDCTGLYMSSVIIGTIGVVMDVSMSITSSIFEIKSHSPNISYVNLFKSGLNIGKDIMSTMVDTLILAYVGSSLPLLMIYLSTGSNLLYSMNSEIITMEIIRSICGSIGIISTIPLTCLLATSCTDKRKRLAKRSYTRENIY